MLSQTWEDVNQNLEVRTLGSSSSGEPPTSPPRPDRTILYVWRGNVCKRLACKSYVSLLARVLFLELQEVHSSDTGAFGAVCSLLAARLISQLVSVSSEVLLLSGWRFINSQWTLTSVLLLTPLTFPLSRSRVSSFLSLLLTFLLNPGRPKRCLGGRVRAEEKYPLLLRFLFSFAGFAASFAFRLPHKVAGPPAAPVLSLLTENVSLINLDS